MLNIPSVAVGEKVDVVKTAPGTVMKPFKGPTRRFAVGYVLTDADSPDLPMSLADLRAGGLVA